MNKMEVIFYWNFKFFKVLEYTLYNVTDVDGQKLTHQKRTEVMLSVSGGPSHICRRAEDKDMPKHVRQLIIAWYKNDGFAGMSINEYLEACGEDPGSPPDWWGPYDI